MESNHVIPRYQRGAFTVWLVLPVQAWSQERSNLLLPGFNRPLHHQSLRTVGLLENRANEGALAGFIEDEGSLVLRIEQAEPAVGIEPTALGYGPSVLAIRTSPAVVVRVVGGSRTRILSVAC